MKLLKKYAQQENFNIKIIKAWQDSYSNLLVIIDTLGKKYSVIGKVNEQKWSHFHGIGCNQKTASMPAGRGDYLVGDPIDQIISQKISEALTTDEYQIETINNKSGISWAPKSTAEQQSLANLIQKSAEINTYLSQIGMIYSGSDKLIYGEDISPEDILSWKLPQTNTPTTPTENKPTEKTKQISSRQPKTNKSGSGILGGTSPEWIGSNGYIDGPKHHALRPMGNWQSDNAWDVGSPPGTPIFSITPGTVLKVKNSPEGNPKVYGMQITITSDEGLPNVFYTHTAGVTVSAGDRVEIGTQLAQIASPNSKGMPSHVHVGLSDGAISQFVNSDGSFK